VFEKWSELLPVYYFECGDSIQRLVIMLRRRWTSAAVALTPSSAL